jgi:hypothetical protein
MAADVIAWHLSSGGKIDPNTEVWNVVPLPWEVFQEKAFCNKEMIIRACKDAGIDPEKSGWIAPRTHGVSEFKPTSGARSWNNCFQSFYGQDFKTKQIFFRKTLKQNIG